MSVCVNSACILSLFYITIHIRLYPILYRRSIWMLSSSVQCSLPSKEFFEKCLAAESLSYEIL